MLNSNFFKTITVSLILGTNVVCAGTMGPVCSPASVTVPCKYMGWDLGVDALYLQPSYGEALGYLGTTNDVNTGEITGMVKNNPKWTWGFKLEAAYHFNTGNDFNLNWYHLGKKTTEVNANNIIGFGQRSMDTNVAAITPQWDAVNIEFGQHVDFCLLKNIRFHGGAQYARIKTEKLNTNTVSILGDSNDEIMYSSSFGPRIGTDLLYAWDNGFSIYANTATAILVGTSKFNSLVQNSDFPEFGLTYHANKRSIIPELEAKLGINYTYTAGPGSLLLNLGYMWVNYFHAQPNMIHQGPGVPSNYATEVNFAVQGPYAGLKWVGKNS